MYTLLILAWLFSGKFIFISITRNRYQSNWYESIRLAASQVGATLRSGFAFTRTVIFLSRIIKPDDSIPRDIVCRVNITKTLRGRRRASRRVLAAFIHAVRGSFWYELRTFGFPFGDASRLDESTLSEGHPRRPSRTRHAHSRGLMGIIRRYYLRGGSHESSLTQPCVVF